MIGADTKVNGDIELQEGLIIYGTVNGTVHTSGPLRISLTGIVNGNVYAGDIHLEGEINGNVSVKGRAVLGNQSKLTGDLVYGRLVIEEGAQFEGKCDLNLSRKDTDADSI